VADLGFNSWDRQRSLPETRHCCNFSYSWSHVFKV